MLTPTFRRILYVPMYIILFLFYKTFILQGQNIGNNISVAVMDEYTFGGDVADIANCVVPTLDGGYLLAGYTKSLGAGGEDIWLIKTNDAGALLWEKTIGGKKNDAVTAALPLADGNFILVGYTCSKGAGRSDVWVLKIDNSGNPLWESNFGGSDSDAANAITATSDGGFAVAGYYLKDKEKKSEPIASTNTNDFALSLKKTAMRSQVMWLLKFSREGVLQWNKVFDEIGENGNAVSVCETGNGDLVVAGNIITSNKSSEILIAKVSIDGNVIWSKTYGTNNWDAASSILAIGKDAVIVGGNSFQAKNASDSWLFKLNGAGEMVWEKKFGSAENETIKTMTLHQDEIISIVSNITSPNQQPDLFMLTQLNLKGDIIGNTIVGSTRLQQVRNMITTSSGNTLLLGISSTLKKCYQRGDRNTWIFMLKNNTKKKK